MALSNTAKEYLEEVKTAKTKRHNILTPYEDDIVFLRDNGLTRKEIHAYLTQKLNIKVALPTLNAFMDKLKKRSNNQDKSHNNKAPISVQLEEKNNSMPKEDDDEEYLVTPMGKKVKKSELPKQ